MTTCPGCRLSQTSAPPRTWCQDPRTEGSFEGVLSSSLPVAQFRHGHRRLGVHTRGTEPRNATRRGRRSRGPSPLDVAAGKLLLVPGPPLSEAVAGALCKTGQQNPPKEIMLSTPSFWARKT